MMDRRGFMAGILALGVAPAIVRASSLMGFKEAPRPILLPPSAGDIVIATQMPRREDAYSLCNDDGSPRQYWSGADLEPDYHGLRDGGPILCMRDDGILVMATLEAVKWSQHAAHPLKPVAGDFKILEYRYPEPKRRTPRQVEAHSRFNFVLGTFR